MRLDPELIRRTKQVSLPRALSAAGGDWALIGALLFIAARWPGPISWILCALGIARQQHALAVLMHDAAHGRWLPWPKWNDRLGQLLFASPLFFSLDGYRALHFAHHRAPLTDRDPDLPLNGGYPITRASFRRKIWRDMTGRTYLKAFHYFTYLPETRLRSRLWLMRHPFLVGFLVNGALFFATWAAGSPLAFVVVWLLPQVTILQAILRVRGVAEHSGLEPQRDQRFSTRTMLPSWQTWCLAPHGVHYHVEHHLFPAVPFYHLPELHRALRAAGAFAPGTLSQGYTALYSELVR